MIIMIMRGGAGLRGDEGVMHESPYNNNVYIYIYIHMYMYIFYFVYPTR